MNPTASKPKNLRAVFYVQFRRNKYGDRPAEAVAVTKTRPKLPRAGTGSIVVKFAAELPVWVFEPLDLVAETVVPAEETEPLIRLTSLGPVLADEPEKTA